MLVISKGGARARVNRARTGRARPALRKRSLSSCILADKRPVSTPGHSADANPVRASLFARATGGCGTANANALQGWAAALRNPARAWNETMSSTEHWQRIERALGGDTPDRTPIALWRHFPGDDQHVDRLVERTLDWQRRWDFDLVKFMPSGTYGVEDWGAVSAYDGQPNGARAVVKPAVTRTADWASIRDLDVRHGSYGRQNAALKATAAALGGRVPILQTIFSPLTTARKLSTERLFADLRRSPDAVHRALRVITDVTIRFARDAIDAGAHGVFLATQLASWRLLSADEYQRFGKDYDLEVLAAIEGRSRLSMLHAHGDDIMFDLLADYPVAMMNWHDRLTEPTLEDAQARFPGIVVGGIEEHGPLARGDLAAIESQVADAIAQTGGRRVMIGPGCVVPVAVTDAAIETALRASREAGRQPPRAT